MVYSFLCGKTLFGKLLLGKVNSSIHLLAPIAFEVLFDFIVSGNAHVLQSMVRVIYEDLIDFQLVQRGPSKRNVGVSIKVGFPGKFVFFWVGQLG